jgi:hypothetical protein
MTLSNRPTCIEELDFDGLTHMRSGFRSNGLLPTVLVNEHRVRDENSIIQTCRMAGIKSVARRFLRT